MPSLFILFSTLLSISHFTSAAVLVPRADTCTPQIFCRQSIVVPYGVEMTLNLKDTNFPDPSEPIVSCHYSTRGGAIQICKYDIMRRTVHTGYKTSFNLEGSSATTGVSACPQDKFKVKDNCELPSTMPQGKRRKLKNKLGISRKDSKSDSQGSEDMS